MSDLSEIPSQLLEEARGIAFRRAYNPTHDRAASADPARQVMLPVW